MLKKKPEHVLRERRKIKRITLDQSLGRVWMIGGTTIERNALSLIKKTIDAL